MLFDPRSFSLPLGVRCFAAFLAASTVTPLTVNRHKEHTLHQKVQLAFSFQTAIRRRHSRPSVQLPIPLLDVWDEPTTFHEALDLHMRRHGDNSQRLRRALSEVGIEVDCKTIRTWRLGEKVPHWAGSLKALNEIETRYRLPKGYLKAKLCNSARSIRHIRLDDVSRAEQRRLSWYLPDDFADRPQLEQQKILEWVRRVIISGATDYRQYQAHALKHPYGMRFPALSGADVELAGSAGSFDDPELLSGGAQAPPKLSEELQDLLQFKTGTLTRIGFERNGVWGAETASQKSEHLGLLFGALAASPQHAVQGYGVDRRALTFAILVFPNVWDWYLQWRHKRRGFFTKWEADMLSVGAALTRANTGWLRQSPQVADRLQPISGLIAVEDIASVRSDWSGACDRLHKFANTRIREIERIARVHRDPFEAILPVLEAASPVGEYRKIAEEILRIMPDEDRYPIATAESARSFLMIRLGLHLGVRQRNLRELLVRGRNEAPAPEKYLVDRRRGELRWSERDNGWEVFIPAVAFKNKDSSFFAKQPFRLVLPDLAGLYRYIEEYIARHRTRLLRGSSDPGTFFIKTVKRSTADASYDSNSFYEAWRLITQRYGVYNPYTGRGAIRGLLPHGPHNVRDVLATHVLKVTGSYEQASYAIQDTPDVVAKHYGRFLPQDKTALAARILNKVWEPA